MTVLVRNVRRRKWILSSVGSAGLPSDRDLAVGSEELGGSAPYLLVRLRRNRVRPGQAQVHPLLQVLRPDDDLRPDLVGLDVEEDVEGSVVLPAQVPAAKARVPRVVPVEVERLLERQVAEVHHRDGLVIDDEADARGSRARRGAWGTDRQRLGTATEGVLEHDKQNRLAFILGHW